MITIRAEQPADISGIRIVNERAFGRRDEGDIVDRLRQSDAEFLSLVAEEEGVILGAILFTPAVIEGPANRVEGMQLAPLAVLPESQRQGIGTLLVRRGLDLLLETGCPFVVLVGHPEYYPRFGFERAAALGLACPWDSVPDEAWMACILDARAMAGASGAVRVREEWGAAL